MNRYLKRPSVETPGLYQTEDTDIDQKLVYAHYFTVNGAHWYVMEYSANLDLAFGWAEILPGCGEYGTFSIRELEEISAEIPLKISFAEGYPQEKIKIKVKVEHDDYWEKIPIKLALQRHLSEY